MCHYLLQVVWVDSVENVKEILPWWSLVFRISVGEILRELLVRLELRKQLAHTQFVVVGHCDLIDSDLLEQLLLSA